MKSSISIAAVLLSGVLAGCVVGDDPLDPGEKSLAFAIPKSADCTFLGPNLTVSHSENFIGKSVKVRGVVDKSVMVCRNKNGQSYRTTDHRKFLFGGQRGGATLYTVRAGENSVSGIRTVGTTQYEFWDTIVFVPSN